MDMYAVGICGYILLTGELPGKDCILEGSEVVRFITHTTMGSGSNVEVTPGESPDFEERDTAQPLKPIDEDTAQLASEIDLQSDDPESAVPRLEAALANGFQLPKSLRGVMDRARGCVAGLLDPDPQKRTNASNARDDPFFKRSLESMKTKGEDLTTKMIVISDDGKDLDDELAKVMCSALCRRGEADVLAYVANLAPALMRARLSKGTLVELGLCDTPVAAGSEMLKDTGYKPGSQYEFDVEYLADESEVEQISGVRLIAETLRTVSDRSVTLVLLSGMTDAWKLLDEYRSLVSQKVARVVLMGGIEVEGEKDKEVVKLDDNGYMVPDKAQNNTFDFEAAQSLYRGLQQEGIQMTVVTRWAAYAAKLPLSIYDRMAKTCSPVGIRLQKAQRFSLEHLWTRACMPENDEKREGLPGRCDKAWFSKVFLAGKGMDRTGDDSIWDLTGTFQAYDPLAQMCAVRSLRKKFFDPHQVQIKATTGDVIFHEVVGLSESNHQVKNGTGLANFLTNAFLTGLDDGRRRDDPTRDGDV
jgi:inosine-uridine nucleoside N-ribohydrolase